MTQKASTIAFQGAHGAYSDLAAREKFPGVTTIPCETFEEAFTATEDGRTDLAMIPIDNTLAGRVADVHHLLPRSSLHIIGEHYLPIRHTLLGMKGAQLSDIKQVYSHVHAIPQCRKVIKELGIKPIVRADTAGAAEEVSKLADKSIAAIASSLAGEIYGLDILRENVQDEDHNATRFVVLSREPAAHAADEAGLKTSLFFQVRNIPAALYKAMGGFATNNVQMTKLESYIGSGFQTAFFYAEIEGHPDSTPVKLALEELDFFAADIRILGTYKAETPVS